jgi:hypothetical protein
LGTDDEEFKRRSKTFRKLAAEAQTETFKALCMLLKRYINPQSYTVLEDVFAVRVEQRAKEEVIPSAAFLKSDEAALSVAKKSFRKLKAHDKDPKKAFVSDPFGVDGEFTQEEDKTDSETTDNLL